jgi:membrane protein implicated in regulation of membrane protease activity
MELALTVLIWLIVGLFSVSFIIWLALVVIGLIRARRVRKMMNKTSTEMMRDLEKMFGGRK